MIYFLYSTWNLPSKTKYKKINEIIYIIITLGFGILYPFLLLYFADNHPGIFLPTAIEEFTLIGNVFIFGLFVMIILAGILNKLRHGKSQRTPNYPDYESFKKQFLKEYEVKNTTRRKYPHILPAFVVIFIILLCYLMKGILMDAWSDYAFFIIIVIGIDFAFMFILEDLIRLLAFDYMPHFVINLCKAGLYSDELDTFSSTFVMIFSFGPFIVLSFPIFFIILLISSIADAMSSVVGMHFYNKRHYFPKNSHKTIEGYLAGAGFSFICSIFGAVFSNIMGFSEWSFSLIILIAIIASIIFLGIDLLTSRIKLQDNFLNPICIGIGIITFLSLLNIPLF